MATEYRVVVKTRHGTTHRWVVKKGLEAAQAVGQSYLDNRTHYFDQSVVEVQSREVGCWHEVGLFDEEGTP